jgi:hypothetical protein
MKQALIPLLFAVLIVLAGSCQFTGDDPVSPAPPADQPETTIDLDDPTGGFTFTDEEAAFGEPDLFEAYQNETAYEDPYRERERVREMERRPGARVFRFRAVWGRLFNAFDDTTAAERCPLDWTGGLHMEGGIIIVEKIIAFEPADSVTRVDESTITWVSRTGPHVDGVQVKLICPPPRTDDSASVAATPVLRTPPYSRRFTLAELAALHLIQPVDRCGNGVSINSRVMQRGCPHGHLVGGWRKVEPDTIFTADGTGTRGIVHGRFRGIWYSDGGFVDGYLKGVFGVNSAGKPVFFGKYVDRDGRFRGIVRGSYGIIPETDAADRFPNGWFEGHWIGSKRVVEGRLKGRWAVDEAGLGFFHGVWGMNCSTAM